MKPVVAIICILAATAGALGTDTNSINIRSVAGDYYFGDGTGVNCTLKLSSSGKFEFQWSGCLGIYDRNDGDFSIENEVLTIAAKKPNIRKGFRGTPTVFFVISWGSRMYLVATNEIVEFCSAVNQRNEPRRGAWGDYYMRQGDWEKVAAGRAVVPEHWTEYLLDNPVRGKITKLVNKHEAWLDQGAEQGLLPGMILTAQTYGKLMFSQVRVESVEKTRCLIKCQWEENRLAVSQVVSSLFYEESTH
ncbi:MAG TPA: hypothetical protein VN281_01795 [Verrucomicrobiae bacterium]|jgi:hypothetical protein|nr:hypothetical protein [Verrucomicrobiae bacterium]